jgi:hypothetical protein
MFHDRICFAGMAKVGFIGKKVAGLQPKALKLFPLFLAFM